MMRQKLYTIIHQIPINGIVLFVTLLNTFIVLVLTATVLLSRYNQSNEQIAMQNTEQTTQNIAKSIESLVEEKVELLEWVKFNTELEDLETITNLNSDVVMVGAYDETGELLSYSGELGTKLKEENQDGDRNLSLFVDELSSGEEYYISQPHVNNMFKEYYPWVVTFVTKKEIENENVYIAMDVQFDKFSQYIDKIHIGDIGYVFIADDNGDIVYHPQQQLIYSKLQDEQLDLLPAVYEKTTLSTQSNIYSHSGIEGTTWHIVGVSNIDELVTRRSEEFMQYAAIVLVSVFFISLVLVIILFRGLTRPIDRLIKSMQLFERDMDSYIEKDEHGIKEFRDLQSSFNHMAKRIKKLMAKIVEEEKELQKFELKALQAQINPHFLYNTLDSIFWLCEEGGNQDAAHMVSALSNTFRISTSRGKDEITIREEIKHVESYLVIQNIRYKNQFSYYFEVEESILDYRCLKILLQPFVENAIYHGLNRMVDEGEIVVRGYREGESIYLQVIDNGVGMDEEQIEELYRADSNKTGIGVINVHNRVEIYYGDEYGVMVESELDEGTTFTIKLPIIEGEEEHG